MFHLQGFFQGGLSSLYEEENELQDKIGKNNPDKGPSLEMSNSILLL